MGHALSPSENQGGGGKWLFDPMNNGCVFFLPKRKGREVMVFKQRNVLERLTNTAGAEAGAKTWSGFGRGSTSPWNFANRNLSIAFRLISKSESGVICRGRGKSLAAGSKQSGVILDTERSVRGDGQRSKPDRSAAVPCARQVCGRPFGGIARAEPQSLAMTHERWTRIHLKTSRLLGGNAERHTIGRSAHGRTISIRSEKRIHLRDQPQN